MSLSLQDTFILVILTKRSPQLKDDSSMSKEELAANIEELKANLEIIDNAFKDIKNISPKISDEVVSKLQGELNKTREGIAKLENLLSE